MEPHVKNPARLRSLAAIIAALLPVLAGTSHAQSLMQQALVQGRGAAFDSAHVHYLRAARYASSGRIAAARREMRQALEFMPDDPQLQMDMATLQIAGGDSLAGVREIQRLASGDNPYPPAVVQLGDLEVSRGNFPAALALYSQLTHGDTPYPPALLRLGGLAQEDGRRRDAVNYYRRAIQADSNHVEAYVFLGAVYMVMDNFTKAVQVFSEARDRAPQNPLINQMLALAVDRRDSYEQEMAAGKMRARIIVLDTRQRADEIHDQLEAGADFIALASSESTHAPTREVGGDLWFFGPDELLPELERAVRNTPVGQFSDIVNTPMGYVIVYRVN